MRHTRTKVVEITERNRRFKRLFASRLKKDASANQATFVERSVSTAYIVNSAVKRRLPLGGEMGNVGIACE